MLATQVEGQINLFLKVQSYSVAKNLNNHKYSHVKYREGLVLHSVLSPLYLGL